MIAELLITAACAGRPDLPSTACTKTLEAGSKQTGIEKNINMVEDFTTNTVKKKVLPVTGEVVWVIAGIGYKTSQTHELEYTFPVKTSLFRIDTVSTKIGMNSNATNTLSLGWSF